MKLTNLRAALLLNNFNCGQSFFCPYILVDIGHQNMYKTSFFNPDILSFSHNLLTSKPCGYFKQRQGLTNFTILKICQQCSP